MMRIKIAVPAAGSATAYHIAATLPDCISCTIRQEYNTGVWQLDMEYLPTGEYANLLVVGNAIVCTPNPVQGQQSFRIAKIRRSLGGTIGVTAYHISYMHSSEVCLPFVNGGQAWSAAQAWSASINSIANPLQGVKLCTITDTAAGAFGVHLLRPKSFRELIFDQLIPAYGGAVTFNNLTVTWGPETNPDRGVRLLGGVNVVGCSTEADTSGWESGIYPFYGEHGNESQPYLDLGEVISYGLDLPENIIPMDFTSRFESPPTATKLRSVAERYAQQRAAEFHPLAIEIERIPDDAVIMPGDTVHINVRQLGVVADRVVTAIVYDALRGVISSVEVGSQEKNTLAKLLTGEMR